MDLEISCRARGLLRASSLSVDGTVPYRPSHESAVPATGGVYLIHDLRGCLYIGRSDALRARFSQHYAYSHNQLLRRALRVTVGEIRFSWVLEHGEMQRSLEKRLIAELQPLCNEIHYTTSEET